MLTLHAVQFAHSERLLFLCCSDSPPHVPPGELSTQMVIDVLTNMTQTIRQHFPNLTVFPALGNHDYWPQVIKDLAHSTGEVGDEGEISFKKKKKNQCCLKLEMKH